MRKSLATAVASGFLLMAAPFVVSAAANAAPGDQPNITTPEAPTPANGGDNGWGNCGHNSSGGAPHTGDNGSGNGNGGDAASGCPAPSQTPTLPLG